MKIPVSQKFIEFEKISVELAEKQKENEKKIAAFKRQLAVESGVTALQKKYSDVYNEADTETRGLHSEFLRDIYEGKHGRGDLYLISGYFCKGIPAKVCRLLFIGERKKTANKEIIRKKYGDIFWRSIPKDLNSHYSADKVSYEWAEVGLEKVETTVAELEEFFNELKKSHEIGFLIKAFPAGFKPILEAGEILKMGSCTHHSGDIDCFGIVLPTGRLAVITNYDGECRIGPDAVFQGVIDNPTWEADLTAKGKDLKNSTELLPLTTEEIAFLKGIEVETNPDKIVGLAGLIE